MSYRTTVFTTANSRNVARPHRAKKRAPSRLIRQLLDTLETWQQRSRQRARLAELDDCMLKDIGLTRADVVREVNKLFWQS